MRFSLAISLFMTGLCLFAAIGCQPAEQVNTLVLSAELPENTGWAITNQGRHTASFTLDINGQFWASTAKIVARLKKGSADEHSFVLNSLAYVHQLSRNALPLSGAGWVHSPEAFLNSLGKGYCDDRAAALCRIWQLAGLPARIWHLEGHTVPEVLLAGSWQVFDPETGVYFLDARGRICSVAEIAGGQARSFVLQDGVYPITPEKSPLLFLDKYYSEADNYLADWYLAESALPDSTFQLPPGASISCCWPGAQAQPYHYAKVKLPPRSSGRLYIPLAIADYPESLKGWFPQRDTLCPPAELSNPGDDTLTLRYYVNPFLPGLQAQNRFQMSGTGAEQLAISLVAMERPTRGFYLDDFRRRLLLSDELADFTNMHLPRLPKLESLDDLPAFFRAYQLDKGASAAELAQRQKAFAERFEIARGLIRKHPGMEEKILQNPAFVLLAVEYYGQITAIEELRAFLEALSL
jgi:hypothetical protein